MQIKKPVITHGLNSTKINLNYFLQTLTFKMANLPKILPLLWILVLIGIQINANPITNDTIDNDTSWLTQWQKCFFNDASEDVGHFFLTRLINCCPLTTPMTTSTTSDCKLKYKKTSGHLYYPVIKILLLWGSSIGGFTVDYFFF